MSTFSGFLPPLGQPVRVLTHLVCARTHTFFNNGISARPRNGPSFVPAALAQVSSSGRDRRPGHTFGFFQNARFSAAQRQACDGGRRSRDTCRPARSPDA